jgi:hypothetical protein
LTGNSRRGPGKTQIMNETVLHIGEEDLGEKEVSDQGCLRTKVICIDEKGAWRFGFRRVKKMGKSKLPKMSTNIYADYIIVAYKDQG